MLQLCNDYRENVRRVDEILRVRENFDIIKKTLFIANTETTFYYIDGFVEGASFNKLLAYFLSIKSLEGDASAQFFVEHHMPFVEAEVMEDGNKMLQMLLSGTTLMLGETFGRLAIIIDSRTYPARSVAEPETDRVMMGSRDGFVETLV
ncbi:MAG: spore germination protein, partial [Clostridia bacterium]|nr:spore germination protein [Clostridia bacterium]